MKKPKSLFFDLPNGWLFFSLLVCIAFIGLFKLQNPAATAFILKDQFYGVSDFEKVSKIDVHFHYNSSDAGFLKFGDSLKFRLISPNVDAGMSINRQLEISKIMKQQYPSQFAFFGTIPVNNFESAGFGKETIARIEQCIQAGASGIKIWKNIGMSLLDKSGNYVMADHAKFDSVFYYLEKQHIPLMAHLGEPKNCWLPLGQMTTANDRNYFEKHPEYHMYLHPEAPSYEDQISSRNHLLQKFPGMDFIGAHLASQEWSVEELAKSFDSFPQLTVDLSARISHLQYQSSNDREKVRNFLIKYQDRIMYGTDMSVNEKDTNISSVAGGMRRTWRNQWIYLATDSAMEYKETPGTILKGLQLPKEVIDKIYCKNADRFFMDKLKH